MAYLYPPCSDEYRLLCAGNVGMIRRTADRDHPIRLLAELQIESGNGIHRATLLRYSHELGGWASTKVNYPPGRRSWCGDGVIVHAGMLCGVAAGRRARHRCGVQRGGSAARGAATALRGGGVVRRRRGGAAVPCRGGVVASRLWESGVSVVVAPTPAPTVFSSVDGLHQQEVLHFLALSSVKKIGDMNWYEHIDDTSIESDMNLFMSTPCTYI
uniref:Uncharacterized protein n=1 Tax=Oryza rufipogon TaxID=4529 RepID=A0A0E0MTT7_ORYRU